jgi:uncharacterized protein YjiS (DUF1127 family)
MEINVHDFRHQCNSFSLFLPATHVPGTGSWRRGATPMSVAIFEAFRPARARSHWFRRGLAKTHQRIIAWRRRARARRELLAADPRMLADLGISRAEADFRALSGRLD